MSDFIIFLHKLEYKVFWVEIMHFVIHIIVLRLNYFPNLFETLKGYFFYKIATYSSIYVCGFGYEHSFPFFWLV
jgi:hypothetical protein